MSVYLIHFDRPLHHARHYIGWAGSVQRRLRHHEAGRGSRLMAAVTAAGIPWRVVRLWPGATRNDERHLKNMKHAHRVCPVCNPKARRFLRQSVKWAFNQGASA